jgi:abortive infection bacteriophage resistance protein
LLLIHFETVFQTYEAAKKNLTVVAQDTLSTTTTAFRNVSKHALVNGISSLTHQQQQQVQQIQQQQQQPQ